MSGKSDIFVDAALKPYNFYLCYPLDRSDALIRMIEDNGGNVVDDYTQTCIIISSKDNDIPDDLKTAHIYSYEVIQDSVNRGAQQEFTKYLIYIPQSQQESTPQQFNEDRVVNSVGSDLNDDYTFDELNAALASTNGVSRAVGPTIHGDHMFHNSNTMEIAPFQDNSVRYFTTEEDNILKEEIRKRHYMGIKGHSIYEEISQLPYFINRMRTPASLRERMRTLKYNVGFVYKVDKNNNLLKDSHGRYIKTTQITTKLRQYSAEDDLILCKTIYFKLDIVTDRQGFEHVVYPTNFFDRFALVYDNHTPESWRQRYKNYLALFGIVNYLKYYIMQCKIGSKPLPSNTADKEFLAARKKIKGKDVPIIYLPNIPQENTFIDDNIEFITPEGYDNKLFQFKNPFKKAGDDDEEDEDDYFIPTEESAANTPTRESTHEPDHQNLIHTQHDEPVVDTDTFRIDIETSMQETANSRSNERSNGEEITDIPEAVEDNELPIDDVMSVIVGTPLGSIQPEEHLDLQQEVQTDRQQEISTEPLFVADSQTNPVDIKLPVIEDELIPEPVEEFIDEPTTQFTQSVFKKSMAKRGPPIDMGDISDKAHWIENLQRVILSPHKYPPGEMAKKLKEVGVQDYYTIFLLHRCNSERSKILQCIVHYVNTDGRELLAIEPGIWSDKSMEMFEQKDPQLNDVLKKYHGEISFKKRCKDRYNDKK